jgi:ATP-binding cassette, subfamily B, bacterial MsbA
MRPIWIRERIEFGTAVKLAKRLLSESVRPNWKLFALSFLCILCVAGSTSAFVITMREMVNRIFVDRNVGDIFLVSGVIVALSFIKGFSTYFQSILGNTIRRSLEIGFQIRQFSKLVTMDLRYFGKRHSTEFVSDLLFAARGSAAAVMTLTNNTVQDTVTLLFLVGVMVWQDPLMSLFTIAILPIMIVALGVLVRRIKKIAQQQIQLTADVTAVSTEAIEGIKVIKSFGLEESAVKNFSKAVRRLEKSILKTTRISALTSPTMEMLSGFIIAAFIIYAGTGGRTPGEYFAFIAAFLFAYEPAKRLANVHVQLHKQFVAVTRLYNLLDGPPHTGKSEQITNAADQIKTGDISFDRVSFFYEPEKPALQDTTFTIRHGERVAIVGRSGAGKTTIVNLILGFLTPDEGTITIGGRDISTLPYETLRRGVSLIAQDVFLFEGTIRDNIRDGNKNADEAAIRKAADAAAVSIFASEMPMGLDSEIGPNGGLLSGGQRQRVSIARALLKDAPILIYDEATSALDGESERAVMAASLEDIGDRTVICIAHRLSTIKSFNRIIVLDAGKIIADGSYDEIATRNDIFRSIFHLHANGGDGLELVGTNQNDHYSTALSARE